MLRKTKKKCLHRKVRKVGQGVLEDSQTIEKAWNIPNSNFKELFGNNDLSEYW